MTDPVDAGDWRPGATLDILRRRAAVLRLIRRFFDERGVLEVETPILSAAAVTDPHLESLETRFVGPGATVGKRLYFQTSPEFAMKRLLAAGGGAIYQLARVFRGGEAGRLHNPEFTLLEWYRPGLDYIGMMDEVEALVSAVLGGTQRFDRLAYKEIFERQLGVDPHRATIARLHECARDHGIDAAAKDSPLDRDGWLDLLMSHAIQPALGTDRPAFVHDYPASQAALARIRSDNPLVAERFELFVGGVELANGYTELTDPIEQRHRFEQDRSVRQRAGLPDIQPDERLLAALQHGLPPCAGVALGVDRLVMVAAGLKSITQSMAFTFDRA